MVTKKEVYDYYVSRKQRTVSGVLNGTTKCPPAIVESAVEGLGEDENGLYSLMGEFFGKREYLTMEDIKDEVRTHIDLYIRDLLKIREWDRPRTVQDKTADIEKAFNEIGDDCKRDWKAEKNVELQEGKYEEYRAIFAHETAKIEIRYRIYLHCTAELVFVSPEDGCWYESFRDVMKYWYHPQINMPDWNALEAEINALDTYKLAEMIQLNNGQEIKI